MVEGLSVESRETRPFYMNRANITREQGHCLDGSQTNDACTLHIKQDILMSELKMICSSTSNILGRV